MTPTDAQVKAARQIMPAEAYQFVDEDDVRKMLTAAAEVGPDDELKRWKTAAEYWTGKYEAERTAKLEQRERCAQVARDTINQKYSYSENIAEDAYLAILALKDEAPKE